jgi:hypothetical protein
MIGKNNLFYLTYTNDYMRKNSHKQIYVNTNRQETDMTMRGGKTCEWFTLYVFQTKF